MKHAVISTLLSPSDVFHPFKMLSFEQVICFVHVEVGLALERNIEIGVALHGYAHQPFHDVPEIKTYIEHFAHLRRVDEFVLDQ